MTPAEIIREVRDSILSLLNEQSVQTVLRQTCSRERTKLIKRRLCKLGWDHGFRVAASGCEANDAEWLYDMVWLKLTDNDELLTHQAMVLESEWNYGKFDNAADVNIDFQKLVQA